MNEIERARRKKPDGRHWLSGLHAQADKFYPNKICSSVLQEYLGNKMIGPWSLKLDGVLNLEAFETLEASYDKIGFLYMYIRRCSLQDSIFFRFAKGGLPVFLEIRPEKVGFWEPNPNLGPEMPTLYLRLTWSATPISWIETRPPPHKRTQMAILKTIDGGEHHPAKLDVSLPATLDSTHPSFYGGSLFMKIFFFEGI